MSLFSNLGTLLRLYTVRFKVKGAVTTNSTFGTTSTAATADCRVYMKKLSSTYKAPERPKGISATAERVRLYFVPTELQTVPDLLPNTEAAVIAMNDGLTNTATTGKLMLDQMIQSPSPLADELVGSYCNAWYWQ
jgi:hypothetical protein